MTKPTKEEVMSDDFKWFDNDHQKRVVKVLEEMHAEDPEQFFADLSRAIFIQQDLYIIRATQCTQRRDH